ncbi:MAG: hypothetical protein CMLOHMNK_00174 [Steroidobacteraceae bacterium]|nr:hypothetical protein [Steroidobacteraceae bacterium]
MNTQIQGSSWQANQRGQPKVTDVPANPARGEAQTNPGPGSASDRSNTSMSAEQRCVWISRAAYFRAEHRGFEPGHDVEDWLAAEDEIDAILMRGEAPDPDHL